jgi:cell cycle arrest protein BUB3
VRLCTPMTSVRGVCCTPLYTVLSWSRSALTVGCVVSGSWDKTFRVHIPGQQNSPASISVPEKIFTMDLHDNTLILGMSARQNYIYDLRHLSSPLQKRDSSLKFMTRCIKLTPSGDGPPSPCCVTDSGFISSSIEGRIAYDLIDPTKQSQSYAFRAHRQEDALTKISTVYPVNTLAWHPIHGTFASGGGDGAIAMWDPVARKRVKYYPPQEGSISCVGFSGDGRWMGIAVSEGDDGSGAVEGRGGGRVLVRELAEHEGRRKVGHTQQ